jgi:tetratricopeptide (TPR) repeat protein
MPLDELRRSLDARLDSLSGGPRNLPDRHRTMRAALDWSYAILDEDAGRQLRNVSVFRGGFDVDAAAAIDGPGWTDHRIRVVNALSGLVDASLIVFEPGTGGQGRYRALDVVRDYARELAVEHGETGALARRHAEHFTTLAEAAEQHLRGAAQREWGARLLADETNFRAALSWALDRGEAETGLRIAAALWMFWRWAGLFADGKVWLEQALAQRGGSAAVRLRALWGAGWLAYHQGDYRRTASAGEEILRLAGDGDAASRRNGFTLIGIAAIAEERIDAAVDAARTALDLAEASGSGWLIATSLLNLGTALLASGDAAAARTDFERALERYRTLGDLHFTARTLIQLGYCTLSDAGQTAAAAPIGEAIQIASALGDRWGIAEVLEATAVLCAPTAPERAAMFAGAARRIRGEIAMNAHPPDERFNRRYLEMARNAMGADAYEAAAVRGEAAPLETMLDAAARIAKETEDA